MPEGQRRLLLLRYLYSWTLNHRLSKLGPEYLHGFVDRKEFWIEDFPDRAWTMPAGFLPQSYIALLRLYIYHAISMMYQGSNYRILPCHGRTSHTDGNTFPCLAAVEKASKLLGLFDRHSKTSEFSACQISTCRSKFTPLLSSKQKLMTRARIWLE